MRLIDADALKEDIEQQCALLRLMKDNDELTQISVVLESGFMAQIDKMPTIEERKKGKWLFPYGDKKYKRCSVCERDYYSIPHNSNYCPNCGCLMKGDSDVDE